MRGPDGSLLIEGGAPEVFGGSGNHSVFWHDRTYESAFPGESAAVSPDGLRVATLVSGPEGSEIVRQYDASTGQILSDLTVLAPSSVQDRATLGIPGRVGGFDWSPDGNSLVIAMVGGSTTVGGLYVVDRWVHQLPSQPTVPDVPSVYKNARPYSYASPAMLANGHVVAFEYSFPIEGEGWPAAIVDVDLATNAVRTVFGDPENSGRLPSCDRMARGAVRKASAGPCRLIAYGQISAHGDLALITDGEGIVWLYDGQTVRSHQHVRKRRVLVIVRPNARGRPLTRWPRGIYGADSLHVDFVFSVQSGWSGSICFPRAHDWSPT